ncbi:MAG: MFS transporter [Acidobacteria bacterium]|nr:MFS transporter [Acidobacteriota bacterium]
MSEPETGAAPDSAFGVLRLHSFRLLWINTLGFVLVQSTQRFAFVWLILELGSKSDVSGRLLFVMGLPALFISLPVGVVSDRVNRRLLLMLSQTGAFAITLITSVLVSTDRITTGSATLCAAILGLFIAIGQPVRTAIVPTLVPQEHLMNAIIVSVVASNLALILGPAIAGPAIARWGTEGAFWVQAVLYGLGFIVLVPLKLPPVQTRLDRPHLRTELATGIGFIARHIEIRTLFILLMGSVIFMMSPWMVLGPQFAREQVGATGSSATLLYTMLGLGQFVTSMWLLRNSHRVRKKGLWFMLGLTSGSIVQIFIGPAPSYMGLALILFAWGLTGGFYLNLNQTLLQRNTPPEVMGRVMSVHSLLMVGLAPMGALAVGYAARHLHSLPETISGTGAAMLVLVLIVLATQRKFRALS